jgi:hypothetical protein
MDLSYYGVGSVGSANRDSNNSLMARNQPTEISFNDRMTTIGTQFRFKQDPDGVIYTITAATTAENVWNYEAPQGVWGYEDPASPGVVSAGSGFGFSSEMLPPWGSTQIADNSIANKASFLSDVINADTSPNSARAQLTGGAPYNHRIRHTIRLDKIIGAEGAFGFHPITNHVNADGNANIKRGVQKYNTTMAHVTTAKGGTPSGIGYYNLASYWNASDGAGDGNTTQPSNNLDTLYTANDGAYIGLHERGLNETTIEIVIQYTGKDKDFPISNNPAIWETEPKEDVGLDIYYAASPSFPLDIKRHRWDANSIGTDLKSGPDELDPSGANWYDFACRGEELVKVGSIVEVIGGGYSSLLGAEDKVRICAYRKYK